MPNSRQLARIASTCCRESGSRDRQLVVGRHIVIDGGERQVRPPHSPAQPAAARQTPGGWSPRARDAGRYTRSVASFSLLDYVAIPDLLEQCLGHRFWIPVRSRGDQGAAKFVARFTATQASVRRLWQLERECGHRNRNPVRSCPAAPSLILAAIASRGKSGRRSGFQARELRRQTAGHCLTYVVGFPWAEDRSRRSGRGEL